MGEIIDKFDQVMDVAGAAPTHFDRAVLMPREKLKPQVEEFNTARMHTYIKPSEYEAFLGLIGREPVSSVVRQLILKFIREQNERQ